MNDNLNSIIEKFNSTLRSSNENLGDVVKNEFIAKIREKFINRYSFDGDENFTPFIQRQLFTCLFNYGTAAIYKEKDEYIVMSHYPFYFGKDKPPYDKNGKILNARGIKYFRRWSIHARGDSAEVNEKWVYVLNTKNSVFLQSQSFLNNNQSMSDKILPFAEQLGRVWKVAEYINLQQHDRIVMPNAEGFQTILDKIKSANDIFSVSINTGASNVITNNEVETLAQAVDNTIQIIKFSSNLEKQLSAIEKYTNLIYSLFGIRHTQTFKKERMLSGEVANDTNTYRLNEFTQLFELQEFVDDWNKTFGTTIELVDNIAGDENSDENEGNQDQFENENGGEQDGTND